MTCAAGLRGHNKEDEMEEETTSRWESNRRHVEMFREFAPASEKPVPDYEYDPDEYDPDDCE